MLALPYLLQVNYMYCTTFQKRLFYGISVGLCCCLILAGGLLCGLNMNNEKSLEFLFGMGLLFAAIVGGSISACACCFIRNGDKEMAKYTYTDVRSQYYK